MVTVNQGLPPQKPSQNSESRYPENDRSTEEVPVREVVRESMRRRLRQLCLLVWTLDRSVVRQTSVSHHYLFRQFHNLDLGLPNFESSKV